MIQDPSLSLAVAATGPETQKQAQELAQSLGLPVVNEIPHTNRRRKAKEDSSAFPWNMLLVMRQERLELQERGPRAAGPVYVDFIGGSLGYRSEHGGTKQLITRAVGIKRGRRPTILDATCGLGRDAFLLASLGCKVHMVERHAVVSALLRDGLTRACKDPRSHQIIENYLTFSEADAIRLMAESPPGQHTDVVYLDPMYPEYKSKAQIKKEMRLFRSLLGEEGDTPRLLSAAIAYARERVVVKRPRHGAPVGGLEPACSMEGKSTRYDIYFTH